MPFQSKAQMRTMHAVANDPSGEVADATGIDPASAKKFIRHAGKQNIGKLPERARPKSSPFVLKGKHG